MMASPIFWGGKGFGFTLLSFEELGLTLFELHVKAAPGSYWCGTGK